MPALVASLVASLMTVLRVLLIAKIGSIIVAALAFFGLSFAVNKYSVQPALDALEHHVGQLGAAGGHVASAIQWAGVLNFDQAVTILISAYTVKWGLQTARVFLTKVV